MMIFLVYPTLSGTAWWEAKARNVASGGTDSPPEPNGAGPPSTCARHGTVFGTAPGVSRQLNGLFSRMRYSFVSLSGTFSAKPALEPCISSLEHQAQGTRSVDLVLQTRARITEVTAGAGATFSLTGAGAV